MTTRIKNLFNAVLGFIGEVVHMAIVGEVVNEVASEVFKVE